jgi:ParB-like chromosome segregation protein Spo0J
VKRTKLEELSVDELVDHFVEIGLAQDKADLYGEIAKFNRLFEQMQDVVQELRSRAGDQRRALLALYDHPNLQVRLKAVKNSLALAPGEGRRVLQAIRESRDYPYAGEAGMTLRALDEGIFKPT